MARISLYTAQLGEPIDTEIGVLVFKYNQATDTWECQNKDDGMVTTCKRLDALVEFINERIRNSEAYWNVR
jgi:hypothetical protein